MPTTPAAIATGSPESTAAGKRIAHLGGNAADIAVGAALTATVSEILFASLGGAAFVMCKMPGQSAELIDGGDAMPTLPPVESRDPKGWFTAKIAYGDGIEIRGGHAAVGVPGALAALEVAWTRHGSLPWGEIVAPAVELSRRTYPAGKTMAAWLAVSGKVLFFPQQASRACFFPDGESPVTEGRPFTIPDMPETLDQIAREGASALYQGDLAVAFSKEMLSNGGFVTRADLRGYEPEIRSPLSLKSGGFSMALNPPPSVGGSALATLVRAAENAPWPRESTAEQISLLARCQQGLVELRRGKKTFSGFDSSFAAELLQRNDLAEVHTSLKSPSTTHISVTTADGGSVSLTMSMGYGSGVTIPGTGIACNNSLGEPELNPRGFFAITSGDRLISNMAPTLAWHPKDGRTLAIGSPGADRITTAIGQTWLNVALTGLPFEEAVAAPRLHVERLKDRFRVLYEPGIDGSLFGAKWELRPFEEKHMYFGAVKLTGIDSNGKLKAVADPRRHGEAIVTEF
ncbi:MAG: gamma-glutamyltransferase [Planctomycetota bacterium]|nr:gamma-glutamyltransferase [Planctomycetota bacterium]